MSFEITFEQAEFLSLQEPEEVQECEDIFEDEDDYCPTPRDLEIWFGGQS
jgi:hypothetical protein